MRNAMKHRFTPIIIPLMAFLLCDTLCVFLALTTGASTDSPNLQPRDALLSSPPLTAQGDQTKWLVAAPSPAPPQHCQGVPLPSAPTAALPITPDLIHTTAHGAAKTLGTTAVFFNDHVVSVAGGAIAQHVIAIALAGIVLEVVAPPG